MLEGVLGRIEERWLSTEITESVYSSECKRTGSADPDL
jgi:hypothetical protein